MALTYDIPVQSNTNTTICMGSMKQDFAIKDIALNRSIYIANATCIAFWGSMNH